MSTGRELRRAPHEAGFTLLELLVALVILSLMASLWVGGLHLGAQVWSRTEADATALHEIEAVQDLMRRAIERAYPAWVASTGTAGHAEFFGASDALSVLAPLPAAAGSPALARITLQMAGAAGTRELVMDWQPAFPSLPTTPDGEISGHHLLLSGVQQIEYGYFGARIPTENAEWRGTWQNAGTLPRLVRVRVKFAKDDIRNWPELVVQPMITADAECNYDPVGRSCRGR